MSRILFTLSASVVSPSPGFIFCYYWHLFTNKLSVAQVVEVLCVTIILEVSARTNAAIWMEHHCHRGLLGDSMKSTTFKDYSAYVYINIETHLTVTVRYHNYFNFIRLLSLFQSSMLRVL